MRRFTSITYNGKAVDFSRHSERSAGISGDGYVVAFSESEIK